MSNRFDARGFFVGMYEIGERHAYLILRGGDVLSRIIGASDVDKTREFRVMDVDGVPTTVLVCKKRYLRAILRCRTYSQLFHYLLQKLAENDIRDFFYAIWIGYNNVRAERCNRADRHKANELRNRGMTVHRKNFSSKKMSVRRAAKAYGAF